MSGEGKVAKEQVVTGGALSVGGADEVTGDLVKP
jgi:hypothetical protein